MQSYGATINYTVHYWTKSYWTVYDCAKSGATQRTIWMPPSGVLLLRAQGGSQRDGSHAAQWPRLLHLIQFHTGNWAVDYCRDASYGGMTKKTETRFLSTAFFLNKTNNNHNKNLQELRPSEKLYIFSMRVKTVCCGESGIRFSVINKRQRQYSRRLRLCLNLGLAISWLRLWVRSQYFSFPSWSPSW